MIVKIINTVNQAVTNTSGSSSALDLPTNLVRLVATIDSYITLTATASTVTSANGILIVASTENIFSLPNGSAVS